jgi:hypothetical protein
MYFTLEFSQVCSKLNLEPEHAVEGNPELSIQAQETIGPWSMNAYRAVTNQRPSESSRDRIVVEQGFRKTVLVDQADLGHLGMY